MINAQGYTVPYGDSASRKGVNFFAVPSGGYGQITAGNIRLSDELLESANNIACSDSEIGLDAQGSQSGNNKNILKMLALVEADDLADVGSFEGFLKSTVVEVAHVSASFQTLSDTQYSMMENLETRRQSISSVSIDEEMINMVKAQHAYAAASRMITAIDEALDVLINKTGVVGR